MVHPYLDAWIKIEAKWIQLKEQSTKIMKHVQ